MNSKMAHSVRKIIAVVAFWVILFLTPFVLELWDAISLNKFQPNSLDTLIFVVAAQPFSCFLAYLAEKRLIPSGNTSIVIVNSIIACCFSSVFIYDSWINGDEWIWIASHSICIAVLLYCTIKFVKEAKAEQ